jgi:hypothetical protein
VVKEWLMLNRLLTSSTVSRPFRAHNGVHPKERLARGDESGNRNRNTAIPPVHARDTSNETGLPSESHDVVIEYTIQLQILEALKRKTADRDGKMRLDSTD